MARILWNLWQHNNFGLIADELSKWQHAPGGVWNWKIVTQRCGIYTIPGREIGDSLPLNPWSAAFWRIWSEARVYGIGRGKHVREASFCISSCISIHVGVPYWWNSHKVPINSRIWGAEAGNSLPISFPYVITSHSAVTSTRSLWTTVPHVYCSVVPHREVEASRPLVRIKIFHL